MVDDISYPHFEKKYEFSEVAQELSSAVKSSFSLSKGNEGKAYITLLRGILMEHVVRNEAPHFSVCNSASITGV